jgi:hypothetical protein
VSQEWEIFTVRLVKSFAQAIGRNDLEFESRVWKINSKTSEIIWSGPRYT